MTIELVGWFCGGLVSGFLMAVGFYRIGVWALRGLRQ